MKMTRTSNMATRCEGCAFNSGTEANRHEHTQLVIRLCVEAREPFHCHDRAQELNKNGLPLSAAIEQAIAEGQFPLCAGYVEAVTMLKEKGFYDNRPEWKRKLLRRLNDMLLDADEGKFTEADIESGAAVRHVVAEFMQEQVTGEQL